jgi:hypothetical protein
MLVLSFVNTLPAKSLLNTGPENLKYQTLIKFAEGVNRYGDRGLVSISTDYEPCDVAVMLGWVHENSKLTPHLQLRNQIYQEQNRQGRHVVVADSNLFLYKNTSNPHYYLRYSFDGVFANTGQYCNSSPDPGRWKTIQKDIGVSLNAWRRDGNHILLCLQRDGGWSMGNVSVVEWAVDCIRTIRMHSRRTIVIRPHPGDRRARIYCNQILERIQGKKPSNVIVSPVGRSLMEDLTNCWAVVNHNSSPAVAAAIEGIPIFVTDPDRSQAAAVANQDLALIERPETFDRDTWIQRLAQFHWSHDDLTSGRCWSHMRSYIESDAMDWTDDEN